MQKARLHLEKDYLYIGPRGLKGGDWLSAEINGLEAQTLNQLNIATAFPQCHYHLNREDKKDIIKIALASALPRAGNPHVNWWEKAFWQSHVILNLLRVEISTLLQVLFDAAEQDLQPGMAGINEVKNEIQKKARQARKYINEYLPHKKEAQKRLKRAGYGLGARGAIGKVEEVCKSKTAQEGGTKIALLFLGPIFKKALSQGQNVGGGGPAPNLNDLRPDAPFDHQPSSYSFDNMAHAREELSSQPSAPQQDFNFDSTLSAEDLAKYAKKKPSTLPKPKKSTPQNQSKPSKKASNQRKVKPKSKNKVKDKNPLSQRLKTAASGYTGSQLAQAVAEEYDCSEPTKFAAGAAGTAGGRMVENAFCNSKFTKQSVGTDIAAGVGGMASERLGEQLGKHICGKDHEEFGEQVGGMVGSMTGQMIVEKVVENTCKIM